MIHYPKPMPAVIDPYKYIMENLMPLDPSSIDGVHHHLKAELTDGKIAVWVKDKFHLMDADEARLFAHHLLAKVDALFNMSRSDPGKPEDTQTTE